MADNTGKVVQVIGPVLDVEFEAAHLPEIYNALSLKTTNEAGQEIELIAQVARDHRKSNPRNKHQEFATLAEYDQRAVRVLAGLLRIAIALDRTYLRAVERVTACLDDELTISLSTQPTADLELELFTARERAGLLSLALGTKIAFVVNDQGSPP